MQILSLIALVACNNRSGDDTFVEPPPDTGDPPHDFYGTFTPPDTGSPVEITSMPAEDAAFATLHGEIENFYFGNSPVFGDLTGDGQTDLATYAGHREQAGVYVFEGPFAGDIGASAAIAVLPEGSFGFDISDLDGDGHDDLAVMQGPLGFVTYEFQLYFGPFAPGAPPQQPDASVRPDQKGDLGYVCDANLDGADDLGFVYDSRGLHFVLGPMSRTNVGEEGIDVIFEGTGDAPAPDNGLLCGHDLTGDGAGDLLVRDNTFEDHLWLLDDPGWGGTYEMEDVGVETALANTDANIGVPGDVTGDGYVDVYSEAGDWGNLVEGPLHAGSEPFVVVDWNGSWSDVAPIGDLDGDGTDDLVVGVGGYLIGTGGVFLLFGPVAGGTYEPEDVDFALTAEYGTHGYLGVGMAFDDSSELWSASAPFHNVPADQAGIVYLFSGLPVP